VHLRVQLACAVRCSATGNSLCDASLQVTVDDRPTRVMRHKDGFILLSGLSAGEHRLCLHHPNYRDVHRTIRIDEEKSGLEVVTMRPIFVRGEHLCRLHLSGLIPGSTVYISGQHFCLQLQQSQCPAGTDEVRLFKKLNFKLIPPLLLLCADPAAPETVILMDSLGDDMWQLATPLQSGHKRGTKFYPTQPYEVAADGTTEAIFFEPGTVSLLYDGQLYEQSVEEGEQAWQIQL